MQPSARQQELERLYNARRGHVPHISISDDSHHVTDAFSSYYGSPAEGDNIHIAPRADPRPLSFIASPSESKFTAAPIAPSPSSRRHGSYFDGNGNSPPRTPLATSVSNERVLASSPPESNSSPTSLKRMGSLGAENVNGSSPSLSRHNSTEVATQHFPLNDIDYESSPAAVAQELSNLQAIRRMSMNVDTADPDLPSFGSFGSVPTVAPKHSTSEDDPSKLFWVPARLHPELAPKEFKTFVEERVDKIRRRSGGEDTLSPETLERSTSAGGLRRKKSMLSHQIDTRGNYEDGAERLERKRSKGMKVEGSTTIANLHDLESLVNDPEQLVRRMSLDTARRSEELSDGVQSSDDRPILPPVQASLKRSTRTTYRRGSLKKGERVPFSKRALNRHTDTDDDSPVHSPITQSAPELPIPGLTRVQTEPLPFTSQNDEDDGSLVNTTRRRQGVHGSFSWETPVPDRTQLQPQQEPPSEPIASRSLPNSSQPATQHLQQREEDDRQRQVQAPQPRAFHSRIASQGRTTAQLPGYNNTNPLPNIIETLPDGSKVPVGPLAQSQQQQFPARKSSFDLPRAIQRGAHTRPAPGRQQAAPPSNFDDISSRPTPLPGSGTTRTDVLTMVPMFEEKKAEKKDGGRKSSWKWILGSDDDDKRALKEERKAAAAAASALGDDAASLRSGKPAKLNKSQDKARLDVLQNSIDGTVPSRPRESLVLNREDIRIEDERKGSAKKTPDSARKDKDSGLLSAIFGGKKKSSDSDLKEKKRKNDRALSPEPPPRILKPDIDYNWTRFSILEERAIYRMAHMKLANPRRALYSQVLLSNFMYSYLAKVQMMHPQMQIPASQQQKMAQEQQRQQKAGAKDTQPAEYREYQRWQEQQALQEASTGSTSSTTQHQAQSGARSSYDTGGSAASRTSYEHDDHNYDSRSSEEHSEWPDFRASSGGSPSYAHSTNANGAGGAGDGYSVASTHDYLGYAKGQQPFHSENLWEDEKDEELW